MKLSEWIDKRTAKSGGTRTAVREELAAASGVSVVTVNHVDNGMRLKNYEKAKALSDATKGAVTPEELCE